MKARGLAAGAAAAVLALGGCATVPTAPVATTAPAEGSREALARLDGWHASGRVAVKTAADGWSASFDWREAGGRGELGVRGPFGAGAARITRTPETIHIESGSAAPIDVPAPFDALEPVLVDRLGVSLPIAQLRWWLVGVPAPGTPSAGEGPAFEQSGWRVRVDEYSTVAGAPAPLPRKLVMEREATRVRVLVDRWELAAP